MQIFNHEINEICLLFVLNIDLVNNLSISCSFTDEYYRLLQLYVDIQDLVFFSELTRVLFRFITIMYESRGLTV